ncbi:MAG TPA: HNH endonuclease [Pyrinomonadaceae bacterium]|jgi:5-methylcytosine-specific restriction endonuclease McrA
MSVWTWKQAVAELILETANRNRSSEFDIDDIYQYSEVLSQQFPRNQHVKDKIRQTLQRLRDDGLLLFRGGGNYSLNLNYEELESDNKPLTVRGKEVPETKQVLRNIRLRSTLLGAEIKRRYNNICQVCRKPVLIGKLKYYAEAHHLWPIGSPHFGADVPGNIVVLCPNCHVMFDRGAATILPNTLDVQHTVEGTYPANKRLYLEPWHMLGQRYIKYHHYQIFSKFSQITF